MKGASGIRARSSRREGGRTAEVGSHSRGRAPGRGRQEVSDEYRASAEDEMPEGFEGNLRLQQESMGNATFVGLDDGSEGEGSGRDVGKRLGRRQRTG